MGYEVKLVIGQEWAHDTTIGGRFEHSIHTLGEFDLSSPGYDSRIYKLVQDRQKAQKDKLSAIGDERSRKRRRASTILYSGIVNSHNREVNHYTDRYGLPLVSIPIQEVRDALALDWEDSKSEYSNQEIGYRRFYVALKFIDAIIETFSSRAEWADEELLERNPLAGQLVVIPWGH